MRVVAWVALGWLAACAPSADDGVVVVDSLPDEAVGPPLSPGYLELGVGPVDQGEQVTLKVRGADPGDNVEFLRGAAYGSGACPARLGGRCLQILPPIRSLGTAIADPQGEATLTFQMSPQFGLGRRIAMEAVVSGRSPKTSEVQVREVRARGAAGDYGLGATFRLANQASVSSNAILAHTVEVAEAATVVGFGCQGDAPAGQFKAALYADNGGAPGRLIAESAPARFGPGLNRGAASSPTRVAPGRYWLATTFDQPIATWSNGLAWDNPEWIILQPFGQALPRAWQGGNFYRSPRIDCFVQVEG